LSTVIRTYLCVVTFLDGRRKPRTVVVKATGRKDARKAARAQVAAIHPDWAIDKATATVETKAEGPTGKVLGEVIDLTPAPRKASKARKGAKPVPPKRPTGIGSRGGDANKAKAWAFATELGEIEGFAVRSPRFLEAYKAERDRLVAMTAPVEGMTLADEIAEIAGATA
jgi:hypothetical protein